MNSRVGGRNHEWRREEVPSTRNLPSWKHRRGESTTLCASLGLVECGPTEFCVTRQMFLHKIRVSQRGHQDHDALFGRGEIGPAFLHNGLGVLHLGCNLQNLNVPGLHLTAIPHLCLPLVYLDPRVVPKLGPQQRVNGHHAVRATYDVNASRKAKRCS